MSHEPKSVITNQIRRYRMKRCLRQRDVSERMGLKHTIDLYRWETGRNIPSLMNALKLSAALNCPVEILYLDYFKQIQKEMYPDKSHSTTT